jgi:hypothetical protein
MKKSSKPKARKTTSGSPITITAYSKAQPAAARSMCDALRKLIDEALPNATSKVWHGSPVWFIDDNPVVGYSVNAKKQVSLLFWNGRALEEAGLEPVGKFYAAQAVLADSADIKTAIVRRWLKKAKVNVLDSKSFFRALREKRKQEC